MRIQDAGLAGAEDAVVLAWAAREDRVLLTHDVTTMTRDAYERVEAGLSMPGIFAVSRTIPMKQAIDDILLIVDYSLEGE